MRIGINAIPLTQGGGLTGLVGYVRAMRLLRPDIDVITFAARQETIAALTTIDAKTVPWHRGRSLMDRLLSQAFWLPQELKRHRCDVVMTTNYLVPRTKLPQLVHHRNLWSFESPSPGELPEAGRWKLASIRLAARSAVCGAAANVFISSYLRGAAERCLPNSSSRNHVIPNGLDESACQSAFARTNSWSGEPQICAVQAANNQKANDTLLDAFAGLIQRTPAVPWRLVVTGSGNWEPWKAYARRLGVEDRITWLGYVGSKQLNEIYRGSLCLMFTSYFESFGNPPLEAMAQGCPVLAVNATAMPEVIGDAGVLIEKGDHEGFASAAFRLWSEPSYRGALVCAGHRRAERFTWAESASKLLEILDDLAGRQK